MSGIWLVSYVALWVLVILLAIVVLGLVRQLGVIYLRLGPDSAVTTSEGLEINSPAPEFQSEDVISGRRVTLTDLKQRPSLLIFISPTCGPCAKLMPHVADLMRVRNSAANIVLISQSTEQETLSLIRSHKLKGPVLADADKSLSTIYRVPATPFAYRVDQSGIVKRRGIPNTLEHLEEMLRGQGGEEVVELPKPETTSPTELKQ